MGRSAAREDAIARSEFEKAVELDRAPDVHHGRSVWVVANKGKPQGRMARSREIAAANAERRALLKQIRDLRVGPTA